MAGIPTKLAITVYMSAKYIAIGSSIFSPILKGRGRGGREHYEVELIENQLSLSYNNFLTFWAR
jgi:hypothetical protein